MPNKKTKTKKKKWQTNKATFFMAFAGLTLVLITSIAIEQPEIFFLSNIIFVFSIIAIITGNPFMVTFTIASLSGILFATMFDVYHVVVLIPVVVVLVKYWKRASPAGVIVVTTFFVLYGIVVIQTFNSLIYLFVFTLWPVHIITSWLIAYAIKRYNNAKSWW